MMIITFLTLISIRLLAPVSPAITIIVSEGINPFTKLIHAVGMVEGRCDTLAYNHEEGAHGFFQIRQVRINDYNRRTGSHYQLVEMYDYAKAEKVFLYYASQIGPYNHEKIAKSWNGSGPMTIDYWRKIKKYLL